MKKQSTCRLVAHYVTKSASGFMLFSLLIMLSFGGTAIWAHASPKRIYIAADDHTDYFWTADEDTYRQAFLEMIDYYLDLADATDTEPPEFQSRWNCDGSYWELGVGPR
jgi:alpha-mannosidase